MVRDDDDRRAFLGLLGEVAAQQRVALHAYAVLEGRFDLVATPQEPAGLSRLMQAVARRHASAFNRRHQRAGSLWEGRFRAAVIEPESWLLTCMLYVDQLSEPLPDGPPAWSSRPAHCGQATQGMLSDPAAYWALGNTPFEREAAYRMRAEHALTAVQRERIESALRGGWVLGTRSFAERLEQDAGRSAMPKARGRPRRVTA